MVAQPLPAARRPPSEVLKNWRNRPLDPLSRNIRSQVRQRVREHMRKLLNTAVLLAALLAAPAGADHSLIEAKVPSGKMATASLHQGKPGNPAAVIIHGFLQTREFPTVASLGETLAAAGHTVLTPTLSLGIPRRNRSLPCEAVHAHTMDQDVAEIAYWTRWLAQKGHRHIVLIGHSFGSVQILHYLGHKPAPEVRKALLISLTDVESKQPAAERARITQALRERVARGDNALVEAAFGHCKKYVSPGPALLSYAGITRGTILAGLAKSPVPVEAIMGGDDDRMGHDWLDKLKTQGIVVRTIPGANHFFDSQYEFDLHDAILQGMGPVKTER